MASGPNGDAGREVGRGMRDSRLLIERVLFCPGVGSGRARVTGSSVPESAVPSSPTGRSSPAGSRARARHVAASGPSRATSVTPAAPSARGGFGGTTVESGRGVGAALLDGGLAEHDEDLAAQQVPSGAEIGEEGGVATCRRLQGGVREGGGGVEQRVDGRGEVDRLCSDEDLGGLVE